MRPVQFSDEAVIQAGIDLQAAGRNVTGFAIRQKVGGGNPTRLKQVWEEYQNSQSVTVVEPMVDLPLEVAQELETVTAALTQRLHALATELNGKAVKAAQSMVNEVVKSAGEQRQHADRELLDAAQTVEDLEKQLDDSEARTTTLRSDLEQAQSAVQAHAVEVATLRERLAASEQLAKRIGEETAQVKTELSELKKSVAVDATEHKKALSAVEAERDQVREERDRIFSELATEKAKAAAANEAHEAVEAERNQVREERDRVFSELATAKAKAAAADEEHHEQRKRAANEILRCGERVTRIEAEREDARKLTGAAREETAKLQGRVEALQQQIDGLMKTLASKSNAADPATKKQSK